METPDNKSPFERFNSWIRESITLKLASIGFLTLILLIPQAWIESLIVERQNRAGDVVREIARKWSDQQSVAGPVLVIPYIHRDKIDRGKDGIQIVETRDNAFFLPEDLSIDGDIAPQILHRGIFESVVYESKLQMNAKFVTPDFSKLKISAEDVLWKDCYLVLGITDLRGISDNPKVTIGGKEVTGEPSNDIGISSRRQLSDNAIITPDPGSMIEKGIVVHLPWQSPDDFAPDVSVALNLKGSELLYFAPVGKTTSVKIKSPWSNPAFDGEFLPTERKLSDGGFNAEWKVLHFNRPFSQSWAGTQQSIAGSEFGVRLLIPVDQYQKSIRTAKYGILVILLTFVSLFMVEIIQKTRIHPLQYILVGSALIVYYLLLLSLSEQLGYDLAYLVATIATIGLVTAYSASFLNDRKTVAMFGSWMIAFYGFIFVIIQEQDYSLLLGSVGLFLIIGVIMYFSRKIKWYN